MDLNLMNIMLYDNGDDIILLDEAGRGTSVLEVELLDEEDFIKKNNVQEVTNPIFFVRDGIPTEDGLLSNKIFGITKDERANNFAYIDLCGTYMHPLCYKVWSRMDSNIKHIAHGTKNFSIDSNGHLVEDENGQTGFDFLKRNIDKIKIRSTESSKRDKKIQFLMKNKKRLFISKYMVIPAFYRDVNSSNGRTGVGVLNKHYASLLISAKSLRETQEFGLDISSAVKGRIQETIAEVYNVLCGTSKDPDSGIGLSKKNGYVKEAVMGKTADFGTRLVISAPELKVENLDDMMVDLDHCALPLASAITNFYPFVIFHVKRIFENELYQLDQIPYIDDKKEIKYVKVSDSLVRFSDEQIKEEINKFIHGYSDRFKPVVLNVDGSKNSVLPLFIGRECSVEDYKNRNINMKAPIIQRPLTWCDMFYRAACESVRDKKVLIVRFPIDSCFNQMVTKVRISSTKNTERVCIGNDFYQFYPKIREKDIYSNTSDKFIDTLNISNLLLEGCGGDYDGDQVHVKGVWTSEANDELEKYINSPSNYIDLGGINMREASIEAIQSLYCMTNILSQDKDKLHDVKF